MPYRPSAEVEAIVHARHGDPFAFLGMHQSSAGVYVRTFLPDAESVSVVESATGAVAARAERIHPAGMFVASMADILHQNHDVTGNHPARHWTNRTSSSYSDRGGLRHTTDAPPSSYAQSGPHHRSSA